MVDKEIIVDLLNDLQAKGFWSYGIDRNTREAGGHDLTPEDIADYLLENGVAVTVRCKDCEKWYRHTKVDRERGDCRRYNTTKHESGFCDKGERKSKKK